jgi:hypothetical protein
MKMIILISTMSNALTKQHNVKHGGLKGANVQTAHAVFSFGLPTFKLARVAQGLPLCCTDWPDTCSP